MAARGYHSEQAPGTRLFEQRKWKAPPRAQHLLQAAGELAAIINASQCQPCLTISLFRSVCSLSQPLSARHGSSPPFLLAHNQVRGLGKGLHAETLLGG